MSSEEQPSQVPTNSDDTEQSMMSDPEVPELNTVTHEEFKPAKRQQIEKIIIEYHTDNSIPSSKDLPFEIAE